ncbi:MAG TPA: Bax inhibitor-1/YccA family protein [Longimicrobiaceae bacterium]|nr:Bax inhibitor-1/YccA family protein [Longimicrobiaceae bacterium]
MMRTANPALNSKTFEHPAGALSTDVMTLEGTVNKTGFLLFALIVPAAWVWTRFATTPESVLPWIAIGGIGGLVMALVTIFKKTWAPVTAPLYAALEGLLLGGLSAMMERAYNGIVLQAVVLTAGTLLCLLLAYRSGLIRATENFKLGIVAATGGIFLIYLTTWILGMFGTSVPYIHDNGVVGIGFSLVVVVIAALNLVLDFDFIEQGVEHGAPKFMEWYAAFGLLVTLVWLYIEILRLLSKLRSR